MLASPAALRIASKRVRHASECLVPAASRWVLIRVHLRHPAEYPCSSRSSRVKFTRRGAGTARRGGGGLGPSAGGTCGITAGGSPPPRGGEPPA
eukprot:12113461-Alexandrium_andersonii.AAC.1